MLSGNLPRARTSTLSCPTPLLSKPWLLALHLSQSGSRNDSQHYCGYESWLLPCYDSLRRPHADEFRETAVPRCSEGWTHAGSDFQRGCTERLVVSAGSRKKSTPYDQSDTGDGPEPEKVPTLPQEALSHGAHGLFGNIRRHRAAGKTGVAMVSSGGIHYLVFVLCPSLYHQFFFPYSCFPGWQHPQPHKVLLHNLWTLCPRDPGL